MLPRPRAHLRTASLEDQLRQQQAAAWSAFYAGKYEDAIKLADPLTKAPKDWARMEAAHCSARAYWAAGTKTSQAKAQQIWNTIERASTLNAHLARMKIAKALASEAKGQNSPAIDLLESVFEQEVFPTPSPPRPPSSWPGSR